MERKRENESPLKSFGISGKVTWHQIDIKQELRPSAFLNIAQELANFHADKLGFGYDNLIEAGQVWVLSRIRIRFNRAPKWRDDFFAATWHKGMQGLFGMRDFALFESASEREISPQSVKEAAITGTSAWLIMNTRTRRIERNNPFVMNENSLAMANPIEALQEGCGKLHIPQELHLVHSHQVRYSDIDFNMHANNAKYIDWVMDSVELEELKQWRVYEFQINYIQEAHFGESVEIYSSTPRELAESVADPLPDGNSISCRSCTDSAAEPSLEVFYLGKCGESVIFECRIVLKRETGAEE